MGSCGTRPRPSSKEVPYEQLLAGPQRQHRRSGDIEGPEGLSAPPPRLDLADPGAGAHHGQVHLSGLLHALEAGCAPAPRPVHGRCGPPAGPVHHHGDRLRPVRGRHPAHAHGGPSRGGPHHGHPHRGPEPLRRPHRRHPPGHGRRAHLQEAGPSPAQGPGHDRGRGGSAHQLPLLRVWRGGPRRGGHAGRGGRERLPSGSPVQRDLPEHQHAPVLRGRM